MIVNNKIRLRNLDMTFSSQILYLLTECGPVDLVNNKSSVTISAENFVQIYQFFHAAMPSSSVTVQLTSMT